MAAGCAPSRAVPSCPSFWPKVCGRFALVEPVPELARLFEIAPGDLERAPALSARYNIAPQSPILVVREAAGVGRVGARMRWGLVPAWAREPTIGARMFNARLEGLHARPAFRAAYARRRCLVPASAFYEWRREGQGGTGRQPFAIRRQDRAVLALGAIWEANERVGQGEGVAPLVESVAIVTTAARGVVAELHDRMPLVLAPDAWSAWLDGRTDAAAVDALAAQAATTAADGLVLYRVTARMNSARFEDPSCLEPVDGPGT